MVVAHRRMGKTVSAINHLIKSAIECDKPDPRFAYIAPTYGQAKRVAWDYLQKYTRSLGATYNVSELRADFFGRRVSLYGSDNPDSLRGQYFDGVVIHGREFRIINDDTVEAVVQDPRGIRRA